MRLNTILIFHRSGDFYETFGEDAKTVARLLNLAITKRKLLSSVAIPAHKLHEWAGMLANAGYGVEINIEAK